MMVVVLVAGIGLLLAGLVAIGFGIPINEFGFGNTLILAGTMAACTGTLLLGLWTAAREFRNIAERLGAGPALISHGANPSQRAPTATLPANPENAGDAESAVPSSVSSPPPWPAEASPRDRAQDDRPLGPAAEPAPAVKPRRNLLFASSSRKERERAEARTADPSVTDPHLEPAAPQPVPAAAEPPPASFDDAWPKPERSRAADPSPRRAGRAPSTFAEPGPAASEADRYPPPVREDQDQVTVLKSGVVDGMAYSLYSDGSIEAQMPEGMMRFASIDELRAHLDQRP
ncbi:DUF308 domain-containing protein [Bradyrhizobium sp.]|uniref:DUF308 domain-containing protein n=1 Tax=Bradyrhizobium sp. TaxID=376 RepID=UPI000A87A708|nr:DUF308 domain-containing protein [Bradyrhizobium sp.]